MADGTKLEIPAPASPLLVVDDVADYALVLAHVRHFDDEPAVLAALGVAASDWTAAQRWGSKLAKTVFRGDRSLVDAFTSAFRAEIDRLRAASPAAAVSRLTDVPSRGDEAGSAERLSVLAASNAAAAGPLPHPAIEADPGFDPAALAPDDEAFRTRELGFVAPRKALPFDPGASPTLPEGTEAHPSTRSAPPEDPLERTLSIEVLRPSGLVLPFVATPTMSVEQYASMRASLEVFPDKREVILARYAIGDEAHLKSVEGAFSAVFANDPATYPAFLRRFEEVRARLEGSPR